MLEIIDISANYGDLNVLRDISITVNDGEIVSLLGSNGAGKTTLLKILSGLMGVTKGEIYFDGVDLLKQPGYERADIGIAHIPQGRGILATLSVEENLILGAYSKNVRAKFEENVEKAYSRFPILKERKNQVAGTLSGGQQQMLAIGRALMMEPKLLMLDEPSLGLAPIIVEEVFEIINQVADEGKAILLVEQNLHQALSIASRGYVIETGDMVISGTAEELLNNEEVRKAYLGV